MVTFHADISGSIRITDFEAKHPERKPRVFSVGIAEQNMMAVAAGLAKEGLIPVTGTYGVFAVGPLLGPDPHDDLLLEPEREDRGGARRHLRGRGRGDAPGAGRDYADEHPAQHARAGALRFGRDREGHASSACSKWSARLTFALRAKLRRSSQPSKHPSNTAWPTSFAFAVRSRASSTPSRRSSPPITPGEGEEVSIMACGPMVPEAMRAAWLLKEEYGLETRVVNMHTVKPLDVAALVQAAEQTRLIVTAEEHQVGGFGNIVAGAILRHRRNYARPSAVRHGGRQRPLRTLRQAVGTDAGVRAQRRAHRPARLAASRTAGRVARNGLRQRDEPARNPLNIGPLLWGGCRAPALSSPEHDRRGVASAGWRRMKLCASPDLRLRKAAELRHERSVEIGPCAIIARELTFRD